MKPEVYSCLKMLEALNEDLRRIYGKNFVNVRGFEKQYNLILQQLTLNLTEQQMRYIPYINEPSWSTLDERRSVFMQELITASGIAIAYLRSLESDLDKELKEKEAELKRKEKEAEEMAKFNNKMLEAIKNIPEFARSKIVEETKKSHRNIEQNSRPKQPVFNIATTEKK